MIAGFKNRAPWAAATISFLFGPVISMLYLNKGRIALAYLGLLIATPLLLKPVISRFHLDYWYASHIIDWSITLIGTFHSYKIAKQGRPVALKWYARWYGLLLIVGIPILIAVGVRSVYEPFHIPSNSMRPNIVAGDYFFADKLAYGGHAPQRGEVIIFKQPHNPSVDFVKRIIGMPGERVQLKEGMVYINGAPLPRRQIENYEYDGKSIPRYIETLPEGKEITILKQNSDTDHTSVYDVPNGNYFVLGDNRDNSHDSRFLDDFGYIPEQNIIAKAGPVLWNTETNAFSYKPVN